ncbi:nuclease-related domain-containing protein [Rhizobium gallicum]|uniref:nuclease-related domain-containing protein n=1 Tax=Rhizobium gallicum TaxID=56730 RepID=UPI000938FF20
MSTFSNERKQPTLVFANFELSGRQFDFVVITATRVVVTEVKSGAFPVRGDIRGHVGVRDGRRWLGNRHQWLQAGSPA